MKNLVFKIGLAVSLVLYTVASMMSVKEFERERTEKLNAPRRTTTIIDIAVGTSQTNQIIKTTYTNAFPDLTALTGGQRQVMMVDPIFISKDITVFVSDRNEWEYNTLNNGTVVHMYNKGAVGNSNVVAQIK